MRKLKTIFLFFVIIAVVAAGILFFREDLSDFYQKLFLNLPEAGNNLDNLIKEIGQEISLPPPLKSQDESPQSFLTQKGVIEFTNSQREKNGFPPLKENPRLDVSSSAKNEDMCAKQYFAHESPLRDGVGDLAKIVGYDFIAVGENLALGNFENDQTLVQAWMDSPGHRENILNTKYQDIGVAVLKCNFEGRDIWLAVQHFGLSLSACVQANAAFKTRIELNQKQLEEFSDELDKLQAEIKNIGPGNRALYVQKVEEYNALANQYNNLVNETKILVGLYNSQVLLFNECVSSFK